MPALGIGHRAFRFVGPADFVLDRPTSCWIGLVESVPYFQQRSQARVHLAPLAAAGYSVSIRPASRTKPRAIFSAEPLHRNVELDLLFDERPGIEMRFG